MKQQLASYQQRLEHVLIGYLDDLILDSNPLKPVMQYSLLNGGKRMRPYLVYITGEMLGAPKEHLDAAAAAVECIHSYSLIHDDLPAMDDDDVRRGKATCHIEFDEASAILAGDALQTLAFDIIANADLGSEIKVELIKTLAEASGVNGMCGGQMADMMAENTEVNLSELEDIHRGKTGALISASVVMGALASGNADKSTLSALTHYSHNIGLAFQVHDDVLDVVGDTETLGKPQGSDHHNNKATFPSLMGLEAAQKKSRQLVEEALHVIDALPYNTAPLKELAQYVVARTH